VATGGFVEIGTAKLPAEKETARFRNGQSVKLVFRPEDVCLSQDANLPEGCRRLANGVIEEVNFVGAYERLTVRLDLTHRKGDTDALYEITINTPQRMTGVPIMVTRLKPEATAMKYRSGDRVAIGLKSFSVLPNYTLVRPR